MRILFNILLVVFIICSFGIACKSSQIIAQDKKGDDEREDKKFKKHEKDDGERGRHLKEKEDEREGDEEREEEQDKKGEEFDDEDNNKDYGNNDKDDGKRDKKGDGEREKVEKLLNTLREFEPQTFERLRRMLEEGHKEEFKKCLMEIHKELTEVFGPFRDIHSLIKCIEEKGRPLLKETEPELLAHLDELKKENKEKYFAMLKEIYHKIKGLSELKKNNPEAFERLIMKSKLERGSFELAEKIRSKKIPEEKKEKLIEHLRDMLNKLFDLNEAERENELRELEKRIKELKTNIEKRRKNKDEFIEKRLRDLLDEEDKNEENEGE